MALKEFKINGLELEEETCINCGKSFNLKDGDLFIVGFDSGESPSMAGPGYDAFLYLICLDCYRESNRKPIARCSDPTKCPWTEEEHEQFERKK